MSAARSTPRAADALNAVLWFCVRRFGDADRRPARRQRRSSSSCCACCPATSPASSAASRRRRSGSTAIREELGLNRPLVEPVLRVDGRRAHGDFGRSALTKSTVTSQLGEKLDDHRPADHRLDACCRLAAAMPLGVYAAMRHRSADGVGLSALGQLGIAIPQFLVGIALIALLAGHVGPAVAGLPAQRMGRLRAGGPVARPADAHAGRRPGRHPAALRAGGDARRAQPGLHPHGPRQGAHPHARRCSSTGCATRRSRSSRCSACRSPA